MQIRPKRSKTPIKLQHKPELNLKKQSVSHKNIATAKSNIVQVQNDNEKYNCQSPVFSTFVGASTHQKTSHSTSDNEISIKIALQLAQHHKKQTQLYKNKLNQQEQKYKSIEIQNNKLLKQKQQLEEIYNKLEQKYKKIKGKYKELKRNQENQSWGNFNQSARNKQNEGMKDKYKQNLSVINSHRNDNKTEDNPTLKKLTTKITQLQSQILSKNKTIQRLCQQISQYQQNTFNILKLVDVLQQKVQQLTMDNNLIKGLFRQNQYSQKTQMDLSFKAGGLGGHSERIYKQYEKLGNSNVQSRTKSHIQQNKLKRNYITYEYSDQNTQNYQY